MNDRELLEKAARAARYTFTGKSWDDYEDPEWCGACSGIELEEMGGPWNPLEDDGDAFRLMVGLSLEVSVDQVFGVVEAGREGGSLSEHYDGGSYEATTRRAITRAAAALGEVNS